MKSSAEKISEIMGNDGQTWETPDGLTLVEVIESRGGRRDYTNRRRRHSTDDTTCYDLPDGSVITVAGGGWDLGYPECTCWRGTGHADDCPHR